jgi:uncharacterized protein YjbI with pentapeptide repeats
MHEFKQGSFEGVNYMRTINQNELKDILEKHKLWVNNEPNGERADLTGADLHGADLTGADLRGANLSGANLHGANMNSVDLSGTDLRDAYLSGTDLNGANLSGANLRDAYLSGTNLHGANLSGANLRDAYLNGANLSGAKSVISFYLGQHMGYAWFNKENEMIIKIGCEEHTAKEWKLNINEIGLKNAYKPNEIALYSSVLKSIRLHFKKS